MNLYILWVCTLTCLTVYSQEVSLEMLEEGVQKYLLFKNQRVNFILDPALDDGLMGRKNMKELSKKG